MDEPSEPRNPSAEAAALRKRLADIDPNQFKINAAAMAAYLFWRITADGKKGTEG